jgi:hypothetical protein
MGASNPSTIGFTVIILIVQHFHIAHQQPLAENVEELN